MYVLVWFAVFLVIELVVVLAVKVCGGVEYVSAEVLGLYVTKDLGIKSIVLISYFVFLYFRLH